eukprot:CAMPEP_0115020906 /NCGR_PEP_ID=MMETSP0216-20121206/30514_1 /TAXON_ID=223996 /ORGANISM="Protocruzia adherens, Strain Boccale" /LENGTH=153 /DNA_ID=CAMNT_0002393049 /DNA_START=178 /DNA_END=636 /DNA_ORIENTATION=+
MEMDTKTPSPKEDESSLLSEEIEITVPISKVNHDVIDFKVNGIHSKTDSTKSNTKKMSSEEDVNEDEDEDEGPEELINTLGTGQEKSRSVLQEIFRDSQSGISSPSIHGSPVLSRGFSTGFRFSREYMSATPAIPSESSSSIITLYDLTKEKW